MSNLIHVNALTNFLMKNLNDDIWSVYSANPDSKIENRFVITLKAKKNTVLFDDKIKLNVQIKKNGYIRGLIEPITSCLKVLMYIEPGSDENDAVFKMLTATSLKDVKIVKNTNIISSYIPDRQKCIKLQQIENKTISNKKHLTNILPYDPDHGAMYKEYVNSPEFKKRWNIV